VSEPLLRRDGNLRVAGIPCAGYPDDPMTIAATARRLAEAGGGEPYGPPLVWFHLPPDQRPPSTWECTVGVAMTGMARPGATTDDGRRLAVEDYRGLRAFVRGHDSAIADLGATWAAIDAHARGQGYRVRPYWRLALIHRRLADGNLHPVAEVAVFIDRP
jgi:hypothetical protein